MAQVHSNEQIKVALLKEEESRYATHNGIQTVSFFSFNNADTNLGLVAEHIRTKLRSILEANPWICGHLEKSNKRNNYKNTLNYSPKVSDEHINSVLIIHPSMANFTRKTPYKEMNDECIKFGLSNLKTMFKLGSPISKLVVIPTSDQEVAIIFSMSHYTVDGHTYYKILSMLGSGEPVVAMTIERIPQAIYSAMEEKLSGKDLINYGKPSLAYIKHIVWNNVMAKHPYDEVMCKYIDPSLVADLKEKAVGDNVDVNVAFVSTNDLIVSLLGQVTQVEFLMQTINYRGRAGPSLRETHAGNYENVCVYDVQGYSSPANIRASLQRTPYGHMKRLPGFWQRTRMTFYTSWVFPFKSLEIDGCIQELHLPVLNLNPTNALHSPFDVAVSFRPQPGKLALLVLCRQAGKAQYQMHAKNILGDSVCEEIFP